MPFLRHLQWWLSTAVLLSLFKILLWPGYHSTDFEVHRNWLAITSSLPLSQWYTESTSPWTLDYPPFFAWGERFLAVLAAQVDPAMLQVHNLEYAPPAVIYFQRGTVLLSDALLFWGAARLIRALAGRRPGPLPELPVFVLAVSNAGLLMVDHVHFQYNGFLLGVLLWSVAYIVEGEDGMGALLFAVLLNLKHIFAYVAPVYFVYLFRGYCFGESGRLLFKRFLQLAFIVLAVFALSFGPFIYHGQLMQLMSRLFPVQRGLSHAYWAPNAWALYNFLDKLLLLAMPAYAADGMATSMTRGIVGDVTHVVLPAVPTWATFLITVVAMAPVLVRLWKLPHPLLFLPALLYCTMCSFMFGYHVHEKAILMLTVPLSFIAMYSHRESTCFMLISTTANFSLMPLLFEPHEYVVRTLLVIVHFLISFAVLSEAHRSRRSKLNIEETPLIPPIVQLYLAGLVFVEIAALLQPHFLPRFEFLPLMLYSVYCAVGMCAGLVMLYRIFQRNLDRVR